MAPSNLFRAYPVQVVFANGAAHGVIHSLNPRLSDALMEMLDIIEVTDATVLPSGAEHPIERRKTVYLNRHEVLFLIDMSPPSAAIPGAYVLREVVDVTINVGRYWIAGQVHVPPGSDAGRVVLAPAHSQFIPLTNARILGAHDPAQTFLVHRSSIGGIVVHGLADT